MNLAKATKTSCIATAKFVLANSSRLQTLIDNQTKPVHSYCNQSAINILTNDGWLEEGHILSAYLPTINAGTAWADKGWKNVSHFFDPVTGQGLRGWPTAAEECARYFDLARSHMRQLDFPQGFFYLVAI